MPSPLLRNGHAADDSRWEVGPTYCAMHCRPPIHRSTRHSTEGLSCPSDRPANSSEVRFDYRLAWIAANHWHFLPTMSQPRRFCCGLDVGVLHFPGLRSLQTPPRKLSKAQCVFLSARTECHLKRLNLDSVTKKALLPQ
jgi:hypothetical protein